MGHGWSALRWAVFVAAFLATGCLLRVALAEECTDLPASNLKVYRLTVDHVTVHAVAGMGMEQIMAGLGGIPSAHRLMAIVIAIDTRAAVEHRVVEGHQGYCDAPKAVLIGLGVAHRKVFILHEAAMDRCVKAALLMHEADHYRAVGKAIHDFIRQQQAQLTQRLEELKRQSARDRQLAVRTFEAGLEVLLTTTLKEFEDEKIDGIKKSVDSVSRLAALSNACHGRLGELEKMARGEAL